MMGWSPYTETVEYQNAVVIANRLNGGWIRVSREVFHALDCLVRAEEADRVEFEDKEDERYVSSLVEYLEKNDYLNGEGSRKPRNKTISIELTHRCNLKCVHCCIDADNSRRAEELSENEMKQVLDKCAAWNPKSIMLSGGEPLLRKDFGELLVYLRKIYQGRIIVSTNGTLLDKETAKRLAENADQVDISLGGVDEETTTQVRGSGVFGKVIRAIENLQGAGFSKITLSAAFGDKNEHLQKPFEQLCERLQVRPLIRKFSAVGRGEQSQEMFSEKTDRESYVPESFKNGEKQKPFGVCSCSAGTRELFIRYDGMVFPCPSFLSPEYAIGNVRDAESLEELVSRSGFQSQEHLMRKLDAFEKDRCRNCKVRLFCWTCPGEAEEIKTREAFDDRCRQVRKIFYQRVWGDKENELYDMDDNGLQPAV